MAGAPAGNDGVGDWTGACVGGADVLAEADADVLAEADADVLAEADADVLAEADADVLAEADADVLGGGVDAVVLVVCSADGCGVLDGEPPVHAETVAGTRTIKVTQPRTARRALPAVPGMVMRTFMKPP